MARLTISLTQSTFYGAYATGKLHIMNAKHAERIIAARNSKPVYVNPNGENGEYDDDAYGAYLNSAAYKAYERSYRLALAEARVLCIQRQTRSYATPQNEPLDASALPEGMCIKCMSHVV
jgi:glucosamine 6-phosphate synthetase-like amidotransferase/phosphosugar isomerase protein